MFKAKSVIQTAVAALLLFSAQGFAQTEERFRVGVEPSSPPFESHDASGALVGFDIDLMNAAAKAGGFTVEYVEVPFDALIPLLITGQVDYIISSVTINAERQKRIAFSDPYFDAGQSILVRSNSDYSNIASLRGKPLCAQLGTTGAVEAEKVSPGKVDSSYADERSGVNALLDGKCEGFVNDRPVHLYYLSTSGRNVRELSEMLTDEKYGIGVRRGHGQMLNRINNALNQVKNSGEYNQIRNKWFK